MWPPLPLQRFVVQDTSMQPALRPGDRLIVCRWSRPAVGDLVVFVEPDRHLTLAVKRMERLEANGSLVVRGDNPNVSRDSRDYGSVPRARVLGKVIYRYLPGQRRGRIQNPRAPVQPRDRGREH